MIRKHLPSNHSVTEQSQEAQEREFISVDREVQLDTASNEDVEEINPDVIEMNNRQYREENWNYASHNT